MVGEGREGDIMMQAPIACTSGGCSNPASKSSIHNPNVHIGFGGIVPEAKWSGMAGVERASI